nr:MAG TPA: hypothetical protein [Bacteriophage sp.]
MLEIKSRRIPHFYPISLCNRKWVWQCSIQTDKSILRLRNRDINLSLFFIDKNKIVKK